MLSRWTPALLVSGALLAGCTGTAADPVDLTLHPPTHGDPGGPDQGPTFEPPSGLACETTRAVKADGPALLVRDPQVLSHFPLQRVLAQLLAQAGDTQTTPLEMLQRMFDTEASGSTGRFADVTHCDDPKNGAFQVGAPVDCPRAESALALSDGLLSPGDPDSFEPVALVNRFDLTPSSLETCGEYRIVYAKRSGRTDPSDRVFVIFEGALTNAAPGGFGILSCYPIADAWAALEKASDPDALAAQLEDIYFNGVAGFGPVVALDSFGRLSNPNAVYGATRGQVRISQRMADPWEMRELRLVDAASDDPGPRLRFEPATTRNSPVPSLFDAADPGSTAISMQDQFVGMVQSLGALDLPHVQMSVFNFYNAGESAVDGAAKPDFWSHAQNNPTLLDQLGQQIDALGLSARCPTGDPITPEAIVRRAATQTCAGCHAPQNFLGPDRSIGCGLTWPATLGEVHIDESGTISPALEQVFLPARAAVMGTYLSSCDYTTIEQNLVKVPPPNPK